MTTWIVGDIHGCAEELAELVERLALGPGDRLLSVGDLFHRGPDPAGVMDVLRAAGAAFILGNHELRVLERFQLAPRRADGSDRPPLRTDFPPLTDDDLAGDGRRACVVAPERRAEVVAFLQTHHGFFAESASFEGAGPTPDGRAWCAVHAGIQQGRPPAATDPQHLVSLRRLPQRGRPFWYEVYNGSNLIVFGHTPGQVPRARRLGGRLVTLGIDTACVYGGSLTAYSPELDELVQVPARAAYARL
jgi:hypothetical protein